jgi:hypothetical protein
LERIPLELVPADGPGSRVATGVPSPTGLLNQEGREVRRYTWTYRAVPPGAYRLRNLMHSPSESGVYWVWEDLEIENDATIRIPFPDYRSTLHFDLPEGTGTPPTYLATIKRSTDSVTVQRFVLGGSGPRKAVTFGVKDSEYYVELLPSSDSHPALGSAKFLLDRDEIRIALVPSGTKPR